MERHTTELDVVLGAVLQYILRGRRNVIYTQNHLPTQEHAMKDWRHAQSCDRVAAEHYTALCH